MIEAAEENPETVAESSRLASRPLIDDDVFLRAVSGFQPPEVLQGIEDTESLELVSGRTAVVEVYTDEKTRELVGYEDLLFHKGGYIDRGFNDLDWLPDPEDVP